MILMGVADILKVLLTSLVNHSCHSMQGSISGFVIFKDFSIMLHGAGDTVLSHLFEVPKMLVVCSQLCNLDYDLYLINLVTKG